MLYFLTCSSCLFISPSFWVPIWLFLLTSYFLAAYPTLRIILEIPPCPCVPETRARVTYQTDPEGFFILYSLLLLLLFFGCLNAVQSALLLILPLFFYY